MQQASFIANAQGQRNSVSVSTVDKRTNMSVFFPILEKILALVSFVMSCFTVKVPLCRN